MAARPNLYGMARRELASFLAGYDVPRFHADHIFRWLYARGRLRPEQWTDLPNRLRTLIAQDAEIDRGSIEQRLSASDGTFKYGIRFQDGGSVETVFMEQEGRETICLSSQIGCALDCAFCLTGKMGLIRHLEPGEITGQLALVRQERHTEGRPLNIVFMGMGEPLHNYDAVLSAFRLIVDPAGFALSPKRITLSTSGLVPAIARLAHENERPRLAVSLNATTDEVRDRIMPINRKYPIATLIEACRAFAKTSGDSFTFEYVLLAGINDSDNDLTRLARLVRPLPAKINLIPFNAVAGELPYHAPAKHKILAIRDRLLRLGLSVSIRWSRGADARAACGQLALRQSTALQAKD
jgi:23S rRNA (adenine2503-C2)-methyltransferase